MWRKAIILVVVTFLVSGCSDTRKTRATEIAVEYIEENFYQEMIHIQTHIIPIPIIYVIYGVTHRVYFHPVDMPELEFYVALSPGDYSVRGDAYYSSYFCLQMKDYFNSSVCDIWGGDALLEVLTTGGSYSQWWTPQDYDRHEPIQESLEEMAAVFYSNNSDAVYYFEFQINIERALTDDLIIADESQKIYEFIRVLQESNFEPINLILYYNKPHPTLLERLFNDTQIEINFRQWQFETNNDWLSIETVEQVIDIIASDELD